MIQRHALLWIDCQWIGYAGYESVEKSRVTTHEHNKKAR